MNRRRFLEAAGTAGALGLAGCVGKEEICEENTYFSLDEDLGNYRFKTREGNDFELDPTNAHSDLEYVSFEVQDDESNDYLVDVPRRKQYDFSDIDDGLDYLPNMEVTSVQGEKGQDVKIGVKFDEAVEEYCVPDLF